MLTTLQGKGKDQLTFQQFRKHLSPISKTSLYYYQESFKVY